MAVTKPQATVRAGEYPLRLRTGHCVAALSVSSDLRVAVGNALRSVGFDDQTVTDSVGVLADAIASDAAVMAEEYFTLSVLGAPLILLGWYSKGLPAFRQRVLDAQLAEFEQLTDMLKKDRPDLLPVLSASPFARLLRREIGRRGTNAEKTRLRAALRAATTGRDGAPQKPVEGRRDVAYAVCLKLASQCIKPWFDQAVALRRNGGYASGHEEIAAQLAEYGCPRQVGKLIAESRTLDAAAAKILADGGNARSLRACASRGAKLIGAGPDSVQRGN